VTLCGLCVLLLRYQRRCEMDIRRRGVMGNRAERPNAPKSRWTLAPYSCSSSSLIAFSSTPSMAGATRDAFALVS
jgi:hypothetical protein